MQRPKLHLSGSSARRENRTTQDPLRVGCDCAKCPFAKDGAPTVPVWGTVPLQSQGLVVGECPNRDEVETGHLFVGPSGRQLDEELLEAGLDRSKLALVNAVLCRPTEPRSANDMRVATKCCAPAFKRQTKAFKKLPTIAMGRWAIFAVTGKDKSQMKGRGFIRNGHLINTFHPVHATFKDPWLHGSFRNDVQKFGRLVRKETRSPPEKLITTPCVKTIEQMFTSQRVIVDIETTSNHPDAPWTGLDPTRAVLKVIGLGNTKWGLAFDARDPTNRPLMQAVTKGLKDASIVKVFHNGIWFDQRVLRRYGFKLRNCEDTRDARFALTPTSPLNLAHLATLYDDCGPWKEDEEDDEKGMVFTTKMKALLKYCAQDCVETARVDEGIRNEKEWRTKRVKRLYKVSKLISRFCANMHSRGIFVHRRNRNRLAKELASEYSQNANALIKAVDLPGFKCNPNDMRKIIFARHQTKAIQKFSLPDPTNPKLWTAKGACAVNENALIALLADPFTPPELNVIIKLYWGAMQAQKARGTFVLSKHISRAIGADGRLRPGWNSCGTDTGRLSCSKPNVMNVEQYLRAMYRSAPGNIIVHVDYSQLELRVMYAVSGDQVLGSALASGDVYSADARALFPQIPANANVKEEYKALRQLAKIVHLAFQYGAGPGQVYRQVLKQDLNAKFEFVQAVHKSLLSRYAGTVQYWQDELRRVKLTGYSETRVLRRRRVYPAEPPITEVANYPIQGTASDIMNLATIRLERRLRKENLRAKIITQLHDALDIECPKRNRERVAQIVKEVMERPAKIEDKLYVFPVEIKTGQTLDKVA